MVFIIGTTSVMIIITGLIIVVHDLLLELLILLGKV